MSLEPGSPEWHARRRFLLDQEEAAPLAWWWLSFASAEEGFLGVAIVQARGLITATDTCREKGINPGGEVQGLRLPDEAASAVEPYRDRLLSRDELREADLA